MDLFQVNSNRIVKAFRFIKASLSGDTHEPVQIGPFGDDSCPPKNVKGVKTRTTTESIHVVLGYFNRNPLAQEGEKRLFSLQEDGAESVYVYLKNDSTFEIGCSDGFKITYDIDKKALTVSGDVIAGIEGISLINHTHTTPVGPSGPPIPTP
jgi:hypothetical protein